MCAEVRGRRVPGILPVPVALRRHLLGVFYAHKFTIKAYEFKTGKLVEDYTREIGNPCPNELDGTFNTIYLYSSDTMLMMASEYTDADFREMFADLVS